MALRLPGNVEAAFSQLQGKLFRHTADPLLRALMPLVPLYWAGAGAGSGAESGLGESAPASDFYTEALPHRSPLRLGAALSSEPVELDEQMAWVPLIPGGAVWELARSLTAYIPAGERVPCPLPRGVLLGWRQAAPDGQAPAVPQNESGPANAQSWKVPGSRISRVEGAVLRLRSDEQALRSSQVLYWEQLTTFRVRRAPKQESSARDRGTTP